MMTLSQAKRPSLIEGAIRAGGDPFANRPKPDDHSHADSSVPSYDGSTKTKVTNNLSSSNDDNEKKSNPYVKSEYSCKERNNDGSLSTIVVSNKSSEQPAVLRHVDDDCNSPDYELNIFYQLCEVILHVPTSTSTEPTRWANIRRWFSEHRTRRERYAACVQQGVFSTTPLHLICQNPNCPIDIVQAMVGYAPETVSWEDTNGWLPLHYGCAKGVSLEVLKVLLGAHPDGEVAQDKRMRTPLHFAFYKSGVDRGYSDGKVDTDSDSRTVRHESSSSAIMGSSLMVQVGKPTTKIKPRDDAAIAQVVYLLRRAAIVADEKGRLPIHFAAAYGTSTLALEALVEIFPRSANIKENLGRTPLHYVMANAHNDSSPRVLKFFLDYVVESPAGNADDEGNIPLHLMSLRVESIRKDSIQDKQSQENISKCLRIYLDAKPHASPDFLTSLQSLPEWLRRDGVTNSYVQSILNQKISNRFPTAILLLDGYLYILIIVCFSYASRNHIHFRYGAEDLASYSNGTIAACYIGATYFVIREAVKVMSMIRLNTFRSWLMNVENWLDVLLICLIYHYCGAMKRRQADLLKSGEYGTDDDENFRSGIAVTFAVLWLSMTTYLKSTMLEFSVFFGSVLYVTKNLFVFMLSLGVILIAFAQMFLIVFRKMPVCSASCMADVGAFPHCSFNKSLLKVYTMLLGEVGEVNRYQQNLTAQILYVAFVFLVVILLSNVLIAIVTDSHNVVKNERAEMVFWSNRLDFVSEMDAMGSMVKNCFRSIGCCLDGNNPANEGYTQPSQQDRDEPKVSSIEQFREVWSHLVTFLKEESSDDTSLIESYLFLFLRVIVVVVVIPMWIGLGLATAGFLWPPQVREWLFVMREGERQDSALTNQVDFEITNMKDHIIETKSGLMGEVEKAKGEIHNIGHELQHMQMHVKVELNEVKRVTGEILDLMKRQRRESRRESERDHYSRYGGRDSNPSGRSSSSFNGRGKSRGENRRSGQSTERRRKYSTSSRSQRGSDPSGSSGTGGTDERRKKEIWSNHRQRRRSESQESARSGRTSMVSGVNSTVSGVNSTVSGINSMMSGVDSRVSRASGSAVARRHRAQREGRGARSTTSANRRRRSRSNDSASSVGRTIKNRPIS